MKNVPYYYYVPTPSFPLRDNAKVSDKWGLERSESPHLSAGLTGSVPKLLFDIYVFFEKI